LVSLAKFFNKSKMDLLTYIKQIRLPLFSSEMHQKEDKQALIDKFVDILN